MAQTGALQQDMLYDYLDGATAGERVFAL